MADVDDRTAPRPGRLVTPRRVVMSLMLAVAAALVVYAFNSAPTAESPSCSSADVEFVSPCGGDLKLRQTEILADLRSGLTGVLRVDSVEIPEDQLLRVPALNQFSFTPGEGKEIESLEPGRHCVEAIYWPVTGDRADGTEVFRWCFQAH